MLREHLNRNLEVAGRRSAFLSIVMRVVRIPGRPGRGRRALGIDEPRSVGATAGAWVPPGKREFVLWSGGDVSACALQGRLGDGERAVLVRGCKCVTETLTAPASPGEAEC